MTVTVTVLTQRDRGLEGITARRRAAMQKTSGLTKRDRARAAIGMFKQVIGGGLHSPIDKHRATEVDGALSVFKCMLALGRPSSVRIALTTNEVKATTPASLPRATRPRGVVQ